MKDYEAEEYRGVSVEYVSGRKAVLTIFHDDEFQEEVLLSDYKTKEEMHALMVEKGFEKMSEEEIAAMREGKKEIEAEEQRQLEERNRERSERIKARQNKYKQTDEVKKTEGEEKNEERDLSKETIQAALNRDLSQASDKVKEVVDKIKKTHGTVDTTGEEL